MNTESTIHRNTTGGLYTATAKLTRVLGKEQQTKSQSSSRTHLGPSWSGQERAQVIGANRAAGSAKHGAQLRAAVGHMVSFQVECGHSLRWKAQRGWPAGSPRQLYERAATGRMSSSSKSSANPLKKSASTFTCAARLALSRAALKLLHAGGVRLRGICLCILAPRPARYFRHPYNLRVGRHAESL